MTRDGDWRRARLADACLYLCTDSRSAEGDLADFLDVTLPNGVDVVQLRDKDLDTDGLRRAAAVFRSAARRHGCLFVVNDDPSLAAEVDADGVHVGQDDPTPDEARRALGPDRLVGRSTHTVAEIDRALGEDCDYFAIGPVQATPTKQGRPGIGLEPLRHAAAVAGALPWFVTGGMAVDTAPPVLATGARRLVVVRAVTRADDPGAAAAAIRRLLRAAA